jgi:hypothetical protein
MRFNRNNRFIAQRIRFDGLCKSSDLCANVIKLSSKTRPGIKMEFETAWEKALCRLFFWCNQGKKRTANKADGTSA